MMVHIDGKTVAHIFFLETVVPLDSALCDFFMP